MKREARLQSGRHWLARFEGKNAIRAYAKWYGVDLICAATELEMLGADIDQEYVAKLKQTFSARRKRKKAATDLHDSSPFGEYGVDWDDHFAFIAGRTSGGFLYGTTWEEYDNLPEEQKWGRDPSTSEVENRN